MSDLINRQAVINAIANTIVNGESLGYGLAEEIVSEITSVENKGEDRPKGHWIYPSYPNNYPYMWKSICSNCNTGFPTINKDYKYCPNCGADMRGEADGK